MTRVIRSEAELSRLLARPGYRLAAQIGGEVVNTDQRTGRMPSNGDTPPAHVSGYRSQPSPPSTSGSGIPPESPDACTGAQVNVSCGLNAARTRPDGARPIGPIASDSLTTSTSGGVESRHAEVGRWVERGPKGKAHAVFDSRTRPEGQAGVAPGPLTLPWPPTGNSAVRHAQGVHYLRPEVIAYRDSVAALCAKRAPVRGRYRLHVHMSPPDARARDIDNALKSLLDALVKAGYMQSDSMTYMRELLVTVDDDRLGHVRLRAMPYDPASLFLAGSR